MSTPTMPAIADNATMSPNATEVPKLPVAIDTCVNISREVLKYVCDEDNMSAVWQYEHMESFCFEHAQDLSPGRNYFPETLIPKSPLDVPIRAYIMPTLSAFTLMTNILVCVVLLKKHMRTTTNLLLAAMAIADLLTGLFTMPLNIYHYSLDNYIEWIPCPIWRAYQSFYITAPTIFHTASIWLTVALAVQRYIFVCRPHAKNWCTLKNSLIAIGLIYMVAFLSHISRSFDHQYIDVQLPSLLLEDGDKMVDGCITKPYQIHELYWHVYWWFRLIFIHFLPCSTLVIMTVLLVSAMRTAQKRYDQLLRQNRNCESRRLQENNRTTLMLVAVVVLFLLVEVPLAILLVCLWLTNTFDTHIISMPVHHDAAQIINTCILFSYPINFFLYCGMSKQFRDTFFGVFKRAAQISGSANRTGAQNGRSRYLSLTTENGNKTVITNETAL